MEPVLYIAVLMIGYIAGAISAGYILRNSRGPGLAESETEFAGLKARLAERDKLLAECRVSLEAAHGEQLRLQDELKAEAERRATMEEKACRVPVLEESLNAKEQAVAVLNVEVSELKARHASLLTRMDDAVKGGEEKAHFLDVIQQRMNEALSLAAAQAVAQAHPLVTPNGEPQRPDFAEAVRPLQESLAKMESERAAALAALTEQVRVLAESQSKPQAEVLVAPLQESFAKLEQERSDALATLAEQVRALVEFQAQPQSESVVAPLQESLARMESERAAGLAALTEQVRVLAESQSKPQAEAAAAPMQESLAKLEQERTGAMAALTEQVRALAESQARPQTDSVVAPLQESIAKLEQERADALAALTEQVRALAESHSRPNNIVDPEADRLQIEAAVKPLQESLERFELERTAAFGALTDQVRALADTQSRLHAETAHLTRALKVPAGRGRWGEVQLQRVVELAGLAEHCDFSPAGNTTDLVIHLPGHREIAVNAKVPLAAYFEALEAPTEDERTERLKAHAAAVRAHLEALAESLPPDADFAVAFLPGETFLGAAVELDPALLEDGLGSKVLLATPTSLIALLKAVSFGWRQETLARNAQDISEIGRVLYDRLEVLTSHFDEMRRSIESSVEAYNRAAGVLEGQVLSGARRFKELGATTAEEFAGPEAVELLPRSLSSSDLPVLAGVAENG